MSLSLVMKTVWVVGSITDTASSQLADIANEWRRLDTHTGEWGIGRAERSAIDFFCKVYFPVYKGNTRKHMPCAFCYEFAILAVEFCDRGKGSVLPNFFWKGFSTYNSGSPLSRKKSFKRGEVLFAKIAQANRFMGSSDYNDERGIGNWAFACISNFAAIPHMAVK